MKEIFSIGHFSIYFFGVTVGVGMLVGILLAMKEAHRRGIAGDPFFDVVLVSLVGGIIGARLIYILVYNPTYYFSNPIEIFRINAGGLSIHGGILGGILVGLWRVKKQQLSLWEVADVIAPALILGQAIGRIGCDVFGVPMLKPYFWGIEVNGVLVHPAQAYEFILDYLLFAYLWSKRLSARYQGQIFVHYLIGFSVIRGIVEYFRTNPTVFDFLSVSYLLSFAGIATGLVLCHYLKKHYSIERSSFKRPSAVYPFLVSVLMIIASITLYYLIQG